LRKKNSASLRLGPCDWDWRKRKKQMRRINPTSFRTKRGRVGIEDTVPEKLN